MEKSSINTHHYDGKLKLVYKRCVEIDNRELQKPKSFEITLREIEKVLPQIKLPQNQQEYVTNTIKLFRTDKAGNMDKANNINVEDLLPRVWRFVRHYEVSAGRVFYEQLGEITKSGSCAQGRTTRLLNLYTQHIELGDKDEVYRKCMKKLLLPSMVKIEQMNILNDI